MSKFRSPQRPAHTIEVGNLKFVGGRLEAHGYDAETVRRYARAHPEVGIVELTPPKKARGGRVRGPIQVIVGESGSETILPAEEVPE